MLDRIFLHTSVVMCAVGVCSVLVHLMIKYRMKFLPESIAFVLIGEQTVLLLEHGLYNYHGTL